MKKKVLVKRYNTDDIHVWNDFLFRSKNGLFMFNRNYVEYHKDRFLDHSLLFYDEDELIAIFPANESRGILESHGGLTCGGLIIDSNAKQHTVIDCIHALINYAGETGFSRIVYKTVPHLYHNQPAEEDIYALFLCKARIKYISASTVLNLQSPIKMAKGRKAQISRAKREGVTVRELTQREDYLKFFQLENQVLELRHNTKAVHTGEEMYLLHVKFPDHIHLFGGYYGGKLISGCLIFEYDKVIHTQYMAANDTARRLGALDLVVNNIIDKFRCSKQWLDFGTSTENNGLYLNEGLISQKEGFGGRTNVYLIWEISV